VQFRRSVVEDATLTGFSTPEALIAAKPDHLINDLTGLLELYECKGC
jgi:hypothetical protein